MRIAQIAPISERVPPKKYGGTERVVYTLTEELVKRGHEVTLFATGDSITSAKLISVYPRGLREAKVHDPHGLNEWSMLHVGYAYSLQDKFDIIHDHMGPTSLPTANLAKTPVVSTIHGPITPLNRQLYETLNKVNLVTISKAQARNPDRLNLVATIHHGLDFREFPFSSKDRGYFLYVGRICMDKGLHHAIEVARYFNKPLIIAAKLDDVDREYFETYVKPYLSDMVQWVKEVDEEQRNQLYAGAICLLHPVNWPEPFGLTMIEAMACGCPVVAFNQGSIPEIVVPGKNGFIANNLGEMIEYVSQLDTMNREAIRDYALKKFSAERMTSAYEGVYQQILSQQKKYFPQSKRFITANPR